MKIKVKSIVNNLDIYVILNLAIIFRNSHSVLLEFSRGEYIVLEL